MRQNTYIVNFTRIGDDDIFGDETTTSDRLTVSIDVRDPMAIESEIKMAIGKHLADLCMDDRFWLQSINLVDTCNADVMESTVAGMTFSNDKDMLIEDRKYLVRYNDHEYCIGVYRNGTLIEIESDLPIQWGSTMPLSWCGPLP